MTRAEEREAEMGEKQHAILSEVQKVRNDMAGKDSKHEAVLSGKAIELTKTSSEIEVLQERIVNHKKVLHGLSDFCEAGRFCPACGTEGKMVLDPLVPSANKQ